MENKIAKLEKKQFNNGWIIDQGTAYIIQPCSLKIVHAGSQSAVGLNISVTLKKMIVLFSQHVFDTYQLSKQLFLVTFFDTTGGFGTSFRTHRQKDRETDRQA